MEVCFKDPYRSRVTACSQPIRRKARHAPWFTESGNPAIEEREGVSCSGCLFSRQYQEGLPPLFATR